MRYINIYLAGAMAGCDSLKEMNGWREQAAKDLERVEKQCNDFANSNIHIRVINPCDYYNFVDSIHQSELEVMKFDLARVKESDIIIVNLNKIAQSIGTSIELYEAWNNGIPVIAYDKNHEYENIHPWQQCCITRVENNTYDLLEYLINFYLSY